MKIEKTNYGIKITIPETEHTSEFEYGLRNVRVLNNNDPREQPLLDELEKREKPLVRKFILLAWSMWNFFKHLPKDEGTGDNNTIRRAFIRWEDHNRMDFTTYYHWGMDDMEDAIDAISEEYCHRSEHGWCF